MSLTPQKRSHFFAYLSRMKLIERWSLMRCTQKENVQEHSLQVAIVAHALGIIKNKHYNGTVDVNKLAVMAIFHDASEVMTGDMPTPVKYFTNSMQEAYRTIENHALDRLIGLLPEDLISDYEPLLKFSSDESGEYKALVKAADTICAYAKCLEEKAAGNREFSLAQKSIEEKLMTIKRPEVKHFLETFVPSFSLTLDEISK